MQQLLEAEGLGYPNPTLTLRTCDQDLGEDALANVADIPAPGCLAAVAVHAAIDQKIIPAAPDVLSTQPEKPSGSAAACLLGSCAA